MFSSSRGKDGYKSITNPPEQKEIEKKFRRYKDIENYTKIARLLNSYAALALIYLPLIALQLGLFKEKHRLDAAKFIEWAALFVCAAGLAMWFIDVSIYHKKQELHKKVEERIKELENQKKDTHDEIRKQLKTLNAIKESLEPESKIDLFTKGCSFVSALTFVVMECVAVAHLHAPFDRYPSNIGGIVDSTAISIGLLSAALVLISTFIKCTNSRKEGAKEKQKWSKLMVPAITFTATIVNLSGRLLQTFPDGDPALGTILRICATVVFIGILIRGITKDLNEYADTNIKVRSWKSINANMGIGDGGAGGSA